MNQIDQTNCEYLTANKTIETIHISSDEYELVVRVYNYKGVSFRVFNSVLSFEGFWKGLNDGDYHFNSEKELDHWLRTFTIN